MSIKKINGLFFLCIISFLMSCATVEPYNPYNELSKEDIYNKVKVIAMVPAFFVAKLDEEKEKESAKTFEDMLQTSFEKAGFKVISSSEYKNIWDPLVEQSGGFYDKVTGEFDQEKYKSTRDIAKKEYAAKHQFDAFLYPRVIITKASWNANYARWHGVEAATTGKEGFWAAMTAPNAYGSIPAYSLLTRLADKNDNILFADFGGIQLANLVKGGSFVDVPEQELFLDDTLNQTAVRLSTQELLDIYDQENKTK